MTRLHWFYLIAASIGSLLAFLEGWRSQHTAAAKETYMLKWLQLVASFAPYILATIPGLPPFVIPAIVQGIQDVEQIPGASGAQKKATVLDLVKTGLGVVNNATSHKVDPVAATAAVSLGIDAVVAAVNVVQQIAHPPTPAAASAK